VREDLQDMMEKWAFKDSWVLKVKKDTLEKRAFKGKKGKEVMKQILLLLKMILNESKILLKLLGLNPPVPHKK
jgi:hypothetical protein